jgi:soluble lytic murein transglycosylase
MVDLQSKIIAGGRLTVLAGVLLLGPLGVGVCQAGTVDYAQAMLAEVAKGQCSRAFTMASRFLEGSDDSSGPDITIDAAQDRRFQSIQARLVQAVCASRKGTRDKLPEIVDALRAKDIDLGNYSFFLLALAAEEDEDCKGIGEQLEQLSSGSVYAPMIAPREIRCWFAQDRVNEARLAIEAFIKNSSQLRHQQAAQILLGTLLEKEGRLKEAKDVYRQLLAQAATTQLAKQTEEKLSRLKLKGVESEPLSPFEIIVRADNARSRQRIGSAKRIYRSLNRVGPRGKRSHRLVEEFAKARRLSSLGLIEIEMVHRSYRKAQRKLKSLAEQEDPEIQARALYLQGDVYARRGQITKSLQSYERLLRLHPDDSFAVEAGLSAAQMAYSSRMYERSHHFARWVSQRSTVRERSSIVDDDGVHRRPHKAGSAKDHSFWLLAWNEKRSGAPHQVVDSYLAKIDSTGPLAKAALYWRARFAMDLGDHDAAEVFSELLRIKAPTSYYALASIDLLHHIGSAETQRRDFPVLSGEYLASKVTPKGRPFDMAAALTLARYDLPGLALKYLRMLPMQDLSEDDRGFAAWTYSRNDEIDKAAILSRRLVMRSRDKVQDQVLFSIAYPRPFEDLVEQYATQDGVPKNLLYAIMREESSFRPSARSPRDARGLMQMIHPTAKRMARQVKLKRFRFRHLFKPEISIRLGAHYVKTLLKQFDGNIVAAIASYHAGEDRVARWLKKRGDLRKDEFIEDIPIESTRRYVKKVLSSYGVYRLLYDLKPGASVLGITQMTQANQAGEGSSLLASSKR